MKKQLLIIFLFLIPFVYADDYNISTIEGSHWFNEAIFNTTTTSGVLAYFFVIILLFCFVAISEYLKIPAFCVITGLCGFYVGILLYATVSAIIGIIFIVLSVMYFIRGFAI